MEKNEIYRKIPKIDRLLEQPELFLMTEQFGHQLTAQAARDAEEEIRQCISQEKYPQALEQIENIVPRIRELLEQCSVRRMRPVINATGIILHTNLGRAPLGKGVMEEISQIMTGYSNLEYDLEKGQRGSRCGHFSENLCRITGAEAAVAVNNNAAAVLVMLSALTAGREVLVSRGELIEIGGKFRIPDVMEQSGTKLKEVGTTNRTYARDFAGAITQETAGILKVHTSNYKIVGFTHEASLEELVQIGREKKIPVLVDLGSGSLLDLKPYGFTKEASVAEILGKGADLVCFSGDKLLGGPQAGILAGKRELIEEISRHPLMRAVRIDKFTAAALDATVRIYLSGEDIPLKIPALSMANRSLEELEGMAEALKEKLERALPGAAHVKVMESRARMGGGTTPGEEIPSICLSLSPCSISAAELERRLRFSSTPVIARIEDECVLLDMRTVFSEEIDVLSDILQQVLLN